MKYIKFSLPFVLTFFIGVLAGSFVHLKFNIKLIGENFGSVAEWLGSIGTLAAVIVSLYLANRGNKPTLYFYIEDQDKGGSFGVQNKSFNPVELEMKWGCQSYMLPLGPIGKEISDLMSDNPFNGDFIDLGIHEVGNESHDPVKLKGYDRVSNSRYKVYFNYRNGNWHAKQYKLFAFGLFCF